MDVSNKKIITATKWSSIAEISAKLVSPITNAVLARLLVPAAFGAIATINLIITFAELFTDAGFQKYIIQHEFDSEDELNESTNVAFWTNCVLSLVLWIGIIIFRDTLAALAGNASLGSGVATAGFSMILISFSSIQLARHKRNLNFKTIFLIRIITSLLPLVVTVPLAVILHNYWALIFGTLASKLTEAIILFEKSEWKPKFTYSFRLLREMLSFSVWTILESITIWLTNYIGVFIVGNILDEYYLGLYQTAITTVNAYMAIISSTVTPVLFSALSRFQNDEKKYNVTLFEFQKWVSLLVIPMGVGMYLYRDLVTQILLGEQWGEASLLIGLWAMTSGFVIIYSNFSSEVYRSKGKPKISLISHLLHLAFMVPAIYISAAGGFEELSIVRSLCRLQGIVVNAVLLQFVFKISFVNMIKITIPSIFSSCLMAILAIGLKSFSSNVIWSIVSIILCIVFYISISLITPSIRRDLIEITADFKCVQCFLEYVDKWTSRT